MVFFFHSVPRTIILTIEWLFKLDKITHMASVELWVVLTTLLLVVRFVLDFLGPWYTQLVMAQVVLTIEMLNYTLVHYTLGLMQLSAAKVNDFFQVWAVLLVTLQYSVKVGHPYSRSKQIPLLDLMSSFWTANLIRVQTFFLLRISLWLIWALNAARIISYFSFSNRAEATNQANTKLVGDYMSYEHELGGSQLSADAADPDKEFNMKWYKYLVRGENQVLKDLQDGGHRHVPEQQRRHAKRNKYGIRLSPDIHEKLVTTDKIWNRLESGESALLGATSERSSNELKDVCLSFALYKLLRRRFYDLPMHEVRRTRQRKKLRRLVFEYILHDAERAFRVVATELSFLQDFVYNKHATLFANGFPAMNLVLSLSLVAATGYIAYPVRYITNRIDQVDHNRITHGVFITRLIVVLIISKELAEIYMYVFSQWTKVLMLCSYTKSLCSLHPLMESTMRVVLRVMTRDRWDQRAHQRNLLISLRGIKFMLPTKFIFHWSKSTAMELEACTTKAIFLSLKRLENNPERLGSYFSIAFGAPGQPVHTHFVWAIQLEADTHRILVWHIATCLCEIDLAPDKGASLRKFRQHPRPFVKKPAEGVNPDQQNTDDAVTVWEHYATASSLSNYCLHLLSRKLVPDNGLVASKVYSQVCTELCLLTMGGNMDSMFGLRSLGDVFKILMGLVEEEVATDGKPNVEAFSSNKESQSEVRKGDYLLTCMGAKLGKELIKAYGENRAGLWASLASFWTEFLLHLAVYTRPSKHREHLAGKRELSTHLWALLSHAGFLGSDRHGHTLLDPVDLNLVNLEVAP